MSFVHQMMMKQIDHQQRQLEQKGKLAQHELSQGPYTPHQHKGVLYQQRDKAGSFRRLARLQGASRSCVRQCTSCMRTVVPANDSDDERGPPCNGL